MAVVPIAALPLPDPLGLRLRPARTRQHCLVLLHAFPLPLRSFPPSHLSVSIGNRDRERVSAVFFFLKECLVRVLLSPGWTAPAPPRPTRSNPPLLRVRRAHRLFTAFSPPCHRLFTARSPPFHRPFAAGLQMPCARPSCGRTAHNLMATIDLSSNAVALITSNWG